MRSLRVIYATSVALSLSCAFVGCISNSNSPPDLDGSFDFDAAGFDAALFEAASSPETGTDSTVVDAPADTTVADTSAPDSAHHDAGTDSDHPDAADSSAPFDAEADALETGTVTPDAEPDVIDAAPDVFDAGPTIVDAGPDVMDSGPDVFDAGFDSGVPQCATNVFGSYYTRTDGTVVQMATKNVVLVEATGLPLSGVTQVFDNQYGGCAIRGTDQTVWCWGTFSSNNGAGQLGNGTFTDNPQLYRATQVVIAAPDGGAVVYLDQATSIAQGSVGNYATGICAVRTDKTLWCWGPSTQGNLWNGTTRSNANLAFATQLKNAPPDAGPDSGIDAAAPPISDVDEVSIGYRSLCYLSAGTVYCMGDNTGGELGTGDTSGAIQPYPVVAALPGAATYVATDQDQTCAIVSAGQGVYCWGGATYTSEGNPARQACGGNFCDPAPVPVEVALPDGGNSTNPIAGQNQLFVGYGFACSVATGGQISCWGDITGTPSISVEAIPFVNQNGSTPSGPVIAISGSGAGGFNSQLTYITNTGVLVNGTQVVSQICP
jgi:hypothetical protein